MEALEAQILRRDAVGSNASGASARHHGERRNGSSSSSSSSTATAAARHHRVRSRRLQQQATGGTPLRRRLSAAAPPLAHTYRTLVVVYGEVRGDALVWATQYRHLVRPLKADLALFCSAAECKRYGDAWRAMAQYVWHREEPPPGVEWDALIRRRLPHGERAMDIARRTPFAVGWQAWGHTPGWDKQAGACASTKCPTRVRGGSGGAQMETRLQLLERLRASGAASAYAYFVLTRSDFYYLCDHPPPHSLVALGSKQVAVPYEDGFKADPVYCSDRHAVVSRDGLGAYLGVLETALDQTASRQMLWTGEQPNQTKGEKNIERLIATSLQMAGATVLWPKLPMFLVRTGRDATRWSHGAWLYARNLSIEQRADDSAYEEAQQKLNKLYKTDTADWWRLEAERYLTNQHGARLDLKTCLRIKVAGGELPIAARVCAEGEV